MAISIESLIPFGLNQKSGELVDVASVARGRECGCICPSCKTILVARQGKQKEWHFAHHSRNNKPNTSKKCEYSFLVSVRLMIRQLVTKGLKLRTPRFLEEMEVYSERTDLFQKFEFVITEASTIELESPKTGVSFSNVEVDVAGCVKGIPFAIYCSYKGRDVPGSLKRPETDRCGVIELNLHEVSNAFRNVQSGRYLEALRTYIQESSEGRSWIYHPRYEATMQKAKEVVESWLSQQIPYNEIDKEDQDTVTNVATPGTAKHHKCVICKNEWYSASRKCKRCNTHLYTTEL